MDTVGRQSARQSLSAGTCWGELGGVVCGAGPKTPNASHSAAQGHGLKDSNLSQVAVFAAPSLYASLHTLATLSNLVARFLCL